MDNITEIMMDSSDWDERDYTSRDMVHGVSLSQLETYGDFNNIHVTKNGAIMQLHEMEDQHLLNTINLLIRRVTSAKVSLDTIPSSKFLKKYYKTTLSEGKIDREINVFKLCIPKYVYEATIRGLNIEEQLSNIRKVLERTGNEG